MVKKRVGLIVLGVVLVAAIPAAVLAQGIPGSPYGGFPSMGGPGLPGGIAVGPQMQPLTMGMGCPPMLGSPCAPPCMPMKPRCAPPAVFEPTVYVGYMFGQKGGTIELTGNSGSSMGGTPTVGAPLAGIHDFRLDYDVEGIWVEGATPIRINDNIGMAVGGSYFFPTGTRAKEVYGVVGTPSATRNWHNEIQWWNVQGAVSYNLFASCSPYAKMYCPPDCMPPNPYPPGPTSLAGLTVVGGFRWDSYNNSMDKPNNETGGFPVSGTDQADCTISSIMPFFGAVAQRVGCSGMFKVGAVGFPALPGWCGTFNYGETIGSAFGAGTTARFHTRQFPRSGYFLEAFAEAGLKIGNGHLGAFVKYFDLHARKHLDLNMAELSGAVAPGTGDYIFSVDRRNWVLGGRLSFLFCSGL